jgi:hypothetical protein
MRVLHDWDDPYLNWKHATLIGFKYLFYAFCMIIGIRSKFNEDIHNELRNYAEILAKLDKLCGVESVFGIRDVVLKEFPEIIEILSNSDSDVRRHKHIGEDYVDPDRKRLWDPPLNQSPGTWHYDTEYVKGNKPLLKYGELPIWHVDRSYLLKHYIEFLYNVKCDKENIYEKV